MDESAAPRSDTIEVEWVERTCPGPYAEGPWPREEVFFDGERANAPVPPVFAPSTDGDAGSPRMGRTDVRLDGSPSGEGLRIAMCGVTQETVTRMTGSSPFTIERRFTWSGTRTEPCAIAPSPPPSACVVVQRVIYPVDVPR